ncbi:hypothetical protein ACO0LM_07370 [Undibacterium sp. Di26W]
MNDISFLIVEIMKKTSLEMDVLNASDPAFAVQEELLSNPIGNNEK